MSNARKLPNKTAAEKPHAAVLQLVRTEPKAACISQAQAEVIEDLTRLLERAKRGEFVGMTYAMMHSERRYIYSSSGEAHRNPTFAAGMVAAMHHGLMAQIHGTEV